MNQKMQKCTTWHPLGIQGLALLNGPLVYSPVATFVMLLTIDQSESCGFRRKARVINF